MRTLEQELTDLLSKHSEAFTADTPDFLLARFMLDCLAAYNAASIRRAEWASQPRTASPTLGDLRFSGPVDVRIRNALASAGIDTLDKLCATKASTIRRMKNVGESSFVELVLALARIGRSLAPEKE